MKILMVLDQIQSGLGTKDDTMLPLGGKKEAIGPAVMMAPYFKEIDANVIACLFCGNGTFTENPEEVSRKLCAMVTKLQPDVVICGPSYNFEEYSQMCAKVSTDINSTTDVKSFCAMSEENTATIAEYSSKVSIVKVPKKGGFGLNDSLKNICLLAKSLNAGTVTDELKEKICFK